MVVSEGIDALYQGGAWNYGEIRATAVKVGGVQVLGAQQAAIAAPVGGATIDSECRAVLVAVLASLRSHGLIAT